MHLLERQAQLEELNRCLQEARAACGKLVLLAGEAGIGKSSLVERFVSEHRRDARTLWGACDALSTPRALAPVHEIAAQTAGAAGRAACDDDESRDWLFRVLLEDLARPERACMVVLEDLHWADAATLDFLRFIGRRIQRTSAVFVATYRDEELSASHPVRLALGELTGHQVIRMRLAPLSLAAVEVLARESGRDAGLLHQVPVAIHSSCARCSRARASLSRKPCAMRFWRGSRAARRRRASLPSSSAISPGRTETWLIESVLGTRQAAVDEAGARGLLDVQSDSVGFRHELARLAVSARLQPERVRAMHGQVLQALAEHGARSGATRAPCRLWLRDAAAVLEYAPLAAREAARLGAHREAAAHLSAALRYGASLTGTGARAELLEQHAQESALANQTRDAIASGNCGARMPGARSAMSRRSRAY